MFVFNKDIIIILVTHRVKDYTRFYEKCVTGRRKCFAPTISLIRITGQVDLAMSVCFKISESIRAGILGLSMQILRLRVQRKFVSKQTCAAQDAQECVPTL